MIPPANPVESNMSILTIDVLRLKIERILDSGIVAEFNNADELRNAIRQVARRDNVDELLNDQREDVLGRFAAVYGFLYEMRSDSNGERVAFTEYQSRDAALAR